MPDYRVIRQENANGKVIAEEWYSHPMGKQDAEKVRARAQEEQDRWAARYAGTASGERGYTFIVREI